MTGQRIRQFQSKLFLVDGQNYTDSKNRRNKVKGQGKILAKSKGLQSWISFLTDFKRGC